MKEIEIIYLKRYKRAIELENKLIKYLNNTDLQQIEIMERSKLTKPTINNIKSGKTYNKLDTQYVRSMQKVLKVFETKTFII